MGSTPSMTDIVRERKNNAGPPPPSQSLGRRTEIDPVRLRRCRPRAGRDGPSRRGTERPPDAHRRGVGRAVVPRERPAGQLVTEEVVVSADAALTACLVPGLPDGVLLVELSGRGRWRGS